ncbi:MAG: proprotein convertase P-domain-containing protein [Saprospiraceae bacterium]|nr:proprotein convertase P-domain-containing protein [Saprospiraceae bacterium]
MKNKNSLAMRKVWIFLLAISTLSSQSLFSQSLGANPWKFVGEGQMASKQQSRQITPQKYLTVSLDVSAMKSQLAKSPLWQTEAAEQLTNTIILPMPDGSFQRFRIVEAPVMHPDLQAQFPEIRSYAGIGIEDPAAYFRGDFTLRGFHGMILSPEHSTVYIDPYSTADLMNYQVYYRKDFQKETSWICEFNESDDLAKPKPIDPAKMAGDCNLRTYRLALACTGEYATYHGGTVPLVLSAMNTTMTRVNGVFEKDVSVHMNLVSNNSNVIFLNASTDPYTNNSGSTMLGQNQTTCDNVAYIGSANYDIGHVFSTGGGGVATLGAVCNSGLKARGVTGSPAPIGDAFDIDYVAHEMGHQYGAHHTFNSISSNCNGNRTASTAYEPGSASTIMGYAGICSPNNIQNNSDDYFHAISVQEIAAEITSNASGGGNTCSVNSNINSAPTANAGSDYVIPRSTPFILTATGSDPNGGDVLTYTWEQMDLGDASTTSPTSTQTTGPVFRSFKGTTNPARYLPRLVDVVNNVSPTWEVLPSVARTLNFRLTVRDNHSGGGCTAEGNMVVTVNGTAGPFLVTSPNTAVSWAGGSLQTVTWDVASTDMSPINCSKVDILLSTDGGLTYPNTIFAGVPNDGSQLIAVPNIATTTARIMVRANGNIFYDISNANFTITTVANGFSLNTSPNVVTVCKPNPSNHTVTLTPNGSFSGVVNLSASGLPVGAVASFTPNSINTAGTSAFSLNTTNATTGVYDIVLSGVNGSNTQNSVVSLNLLAGPPSPPSLTTPVNEATGLSLLPQLTWGSSSGAVSYDLQVSTVSDFATTVVNATAITGNTYTITTSLTQTTTYYWRVRAVNSCGSGNWSSTFFFTTSCVTSPVNTTPVTISTSGTPTITSTITVSGVNGNILAVKLKDLKIYHTYIGDVKATLTSPSGAVFSLFDRPGVPASTYGCDQYHLLATFDNAATLTAAQLESTCNASSAPIPPPYAINGTYQPVTSFATLINTSPNGTWTLTVQDLEAGDGGSLQSWGLEISTNCMASLNLTQTFIQGYMDGTSMRPVLLNSGVAGTNSSQCDTITLALHAPTSPYTEIFSKKTILSTTGSTTALFPPSTVGNSYYLVVKGRNLIETWSATPQVFSFSPTYNFGSASQAFGNNLGVTGGVTTIYNGDMNGNGPFGDGVIDIFDYPDWEVEAFVNFAEGYYPEDLDGNGQVDIFDYPIWEINAFVNFVEAVKP